MADAARGFLGRQVEILLVEDNRGDVVLTKEAFRDASVPNSISVASDGEEALRMLRREEPHTHQPTPDVILLDLNLPRKHGREVIEEISRDPGLNKIPIVVLTSSAAHTDIVMSYDLRANSYVVKPITTESVEKIVALVGQAPADSIGSSHSDAPASAMAAELELSEFSHIVSHDLSAPLRHIAAFSLLLMREIGPNAPHEQITYCNHIQHAAEKCKDMLDELRAFSRVQQAPLTLEPCDARLLMEVARLQLSAAVKRAGAELIIEPLGTPTVDSELMTLVFRHVLSNAIKFRRLGVAVKVVAREVHTPNTWTVQISDNGLGAPLERQEKLFRMFYQDEPEGAFEGVGAGLAISRRILRRHGGDARFIEAREGACLEIRLPRVPVQASPAHAG